jgi:phage tail-like protein
MAGTLHIIEPGKPERTFELKGTVSIGRTPENDIALETEGVSRRHALLLIRGGNVVLVDLGSTNGSFVNGVQALPQQQVVLKNGDLLTIGRTTLRYDAPAVSPKRPAMVAPPTVVAKLPPRIVKPTPPRRAAQPRDTRFQPRTNGKPITPGRYLRYLPSIYHDDDLLDRFLRGVEDVLGPIERTIGGLEHQVNPRLAPDELLPWLAFWVGLSLDARWPEDRRRAMILEAASLYPWRGTKRGLKRAIELATGYAPEIIEPQLQAGSKRRNERWHLFQVVLRVPDPTQIDRTMIEMVIEEQKPAHTSYLLEIVPGAAPVPTL